MARKNENNYFQMFINGVGYSCSAARALHEMLCNFTPQTVQEQFKNLHAIEHAADLEKHDMMGKLVKEFITPIEREDIMDLAQQIDNVTDSIEDVLMRVYMYNIQTIPQNAIEFSNVVVNCCNQLEKMITEFENFKKSTTLRECIVEVNRLEEVGDAMYVNAIRELYTSNASPLEVMAWTETYERFEKCCDACEDVADVVESVIMKNS